MSGVPDSISQSVIVGDVRDRLAGVSKLAMVCFLEGVHPNELPLTQLQVERVTDELFAIGRESPLVAYTFCLERLSAGSESQEDLI